MNKLKAIAAVAAAAMMVSMNVQAGVYTDELSKCLVEKTTTQDRTVLVTWVFTALSMHPAVKQVITVSTDKVEEINKHAANLFTRLLTETCKDETVKAIKFEGNGAISQSFNILGGVAGRELFSSPEVATALAGLGKYLDEEKLQSIMPAPPEKK